MVLSFTPEKRTMGGIFGLMNFKNDVDMIFKMGISRRDLLKYVSILAAGGVGKPFRHTGRFEGIDQGQTVKEWSGQNLSDWEVTLGDSLYPLDGPDKVTLDDIETINRSDRGELIANVQNRLVQAHNISFWPVVDQTAFSYYHECGFEFRLPFLPVKETDSPLNGQTFDAGLFIWDGGITRLDYGAAFQWLTSPFNEEMGKIQIWDTQDSFLGNWINTDIVLDVDTSWHSFYLGINYKTQRVIMTIDDLTIPAKITALSKPVEWSTDTVSRFQAEVISLYPGQNSALPFSSHKAEVRNWFWRWRNPPFETFVPLIQTQ